MIVNQKTRDYQKQIMNSCRYCYGTNAFWSLLVHSWDVSTAGCTKALFMTMTFHFQRDMFVSSSKNKTQFLYLLLFRVQVQFISKEGDPYWWHSDVLSLNWFSNSTFILTMERNQAEDCPLLAYKGKTFHGKLKQ